MADYTFYTNPMSRGQIARWALHEVQAVAAPYASTMMPGTPGMARVWGALGRLEALAVQIGLIQRSSNLRWRAAPQTLSEMLIVRALLAYILF